MAPEPARRSLLWRGAHAVLLRVSPPLLAKPYLQMADLFLSIANLLITRANGGVHPKHAVMNYEAFFLRFVGPTTTVLDVGSSRGTVAAALARVAHHVTGIDIEPEHHAFAKKNNSAPNITWILGDVTTFEFAQRFDICVLSNVLEHIDNRIGLLMEIRRHCDMLLVRVPALDRDWWPIWRRANGIEWRSDETHYIEHSEEELRAELVAAGWRVDLFERKWGEFYVKCSSAGAAS